MSWQAVTWALRQRAGSAPAKAVLLVLAEAANGKTATCYPSQETIAERAELSPRAVWEAVRELERRGLIVRTARRDKRGHRTSDLVTLKLKPQLAADATRDERAQVAPPANRQTPDLFAPDATRADDALLARGAEPTRTSCESLLAPGATEPGRSEPGSEPGRSYGSRKRPKRPVPEVCPTEAQIIAAQDRFNELGLAIDARLEAESFRSHHMSKDSRFSDWAQAWGTWTTNAIKYARQRGTAAPARGRFNALADAMEVINERSRQD